MVVYLYLYHLLGLVSFFELLYGVICYALFHFSQCSIACQKYENINCYPLQRFNSVPQSTTSK